MLCHAKNEIVGHEVTKEDGNAAIMWITKAEKNNQCFRQRSRYLKVTKEHSFKGVERWILGLLKKAHRFRVHFVSYEFENKVKKTVKRTRAVTSRPFRYEQMG